MRITLLQGAFLPVPPLRGGAVEKMWFRLGQEIAARGHEVVHVSRQCDGLPVADEIAGVRHVRLRGYDQPSSLALLKLQDLRYTIRAISRMPSADVVVTNTFWAPMLLPGRCGRIYVDVQRTPRGQMRYYGRAARLRANSSAVAAAIAADAPTLRDRIRIIPNPLPFEASPPLPWDSKPKVALFVGRLHPEKGIELLLNAWSARGAGVMSDWELHLVGPSKVSAGGGGDEWVARLRQQYDRKDVIWHGPIYDEVELARAYARARVFVYPSLAERGETFGVAVLEAMAAGAVPVVSDLACFRDFVRDGVNGISFDHRGSGPARGLIDAMAAAASPAAEQMSAAAAAVRQTHALAPIADRFLEDFETMLDAPPSHG